MDSTNLTAARRALEAQADPSDPRLAQRRMCLDVLEDIQEFLGGWPEVEMLGLDVRVLLSEPELDIRALAGEAWVEGDGGGTRLEQALSDLACQINTTVRPADHSWCLPRIFSPDEAGDFQFLVSQACPSPHLEAILGPGAWAGLRESQLEQCLDHGSEGLSEKARPKL